MNTYTIFLSKGLKKGYVQWTCTSKSLSASRHRARWYKELREMPMSLYDGENDTMWYLDHSTSTWYKSEWKLHQITEAKER